MTGQDLATLNNLYRAICRMMRARPDLEWLLGSFAADERYRHVNLLVELRRFHEWHSDQRKKPKSHKRAMRNWMAIATRNAPAPENSDGMGKRLTRGNAATP